MRRLCLALAAATALAAPAQLRWLATDYDFGAFDETLGTVECTFRAVNDGTEPIVVLSARANCGCTVPRYDDAPVAPGDTLLLTVGYNADGRPGPFDKQVQVTSTAVPPRQLLTIRGTVIGRGSTLQSRYPVSEPSGVRLRRAALLFGNVRHTALATDIIEGYNATTDTIVPRFDTLPPYITVATSPERVPPGQLFVMTATFTPRQAAIYDLVVDELSLLGGAEPIPVTASAIVEEDFSLLTPQQRSQAPAIVLTPDILDLREITPDSGLRRVTFDIENRGKSPLKIRRIYTLDPAVKVSYASGDIKAGGRRRVTVVIDTAQLRDKKMLNARVVVVTNAPGSPRRNVRILGEVR